MKSNTFVKSCFCSDPALPCTSCLAASLVCNSEGKLFYVMLQSHGLSARHTAAKTITVTGSRRAHAAYSSSSLRSLAAPLMTLMLS